MMAPQQYCLRWKHHHTNVQSMFAQLLEKERFCDVTLYCSPNFAAQLSNKDTEAQNVRGVSLRAHRVVLAACSELLGALLGAHEAQGEPVLVIDGAEPRHLRALLDYMYTGEMNVHHSQLAGLLKTAEELRIKGLSDIRWNNKDEPPDCSSGAVTTTQSNKNNRIDKHEERVLNTELKMCSTTLDTKLARINACEDKEVVPQVTQVKQDDDSVVKEKFNLNGGPPPLIKLPTRETKASPLKRDHSDTESQSPKRQRLTSATEHTDDDSSVHTIKTERDQEWRHGNLDITAERVVGWGPGDGEGEGEDGEWSREASDDEWVDPPADIGSFLHTKLRVDGDNSADEDSDDSVPIAACAQASSSSSTTSVTQQDPLKPVKSLGVTDPRFNDVVKLNDYLRNGRRPQFWEEHYVKRVMDAVRLKELEMKQAAEILGVSYGTLYGRYRDVYGCINRPYRTVPNYWQGEGPSEVLDKLQRGDMSIENAALALGVNPSKLAAYVADGSTYRPDKDDAFTTDMKNRAKTKRDFTSYKGKRILPVMDEDFTPTAPREKSPFTSPPQPTQSSSWPAIRVASIESLRGTDTTPSPSQLMKTRPDLTIVAAKRDKSDTDT
ncbi:uncharacterized protein LOC126973588 isoform X2 [Leptidea sinapis]|uniref:uncharacterized protein LOC126973588 isoform X2 n=1 Tax=Leptidea sinapis TaxID=189913 RepID=UPI00212737C5|nr:uncharacterized protein LOC126973588 isoform X2 [Leptidea sinapis]